MIKRIVIYLPVAALTLYCFFMYENGIVAGFLAAEIFYFFFALAELFYIRKKVKVTMGRIIPVAEKDQLITVRTEVENHSAIPAVHYVVRGILGNQFTGERRRFTLKGSAVKKETVCSAFSFKASACGNMVIEAKELFLYDALGIFVIKRKISLRQKTGILPACHMLPLEVTKRTREFVADAEEYSDRESGDDPAEIYQIREYREKDSIHDIHWKLSAKSDELLVKEHGRPLGCVVLIWIDLEEASKDRSLWGRRVKKDHTPALVLEAAASLSISLLEEKCIHMAAWYEKENKRIVKKRVSREEHVYELMHRLLFAETYEGSAQIESIRAEAFRTERFSTTVEFDMRGRILVNGRQSFQLDASKDTEWEKLVLTV